MKRFLWTFLAVSLLASVMEVAGLIHPGMIAQAQDSSDSADGAESPGESRSEAFRAVDGPTEEDVSGFKLLVAAYLAIWAIVFGYLWRLARLQKTLRRDLERLQSSQAVQKR